MASLEARKAAARAMTAYTLHEIRVPMQSLALGLQEIRYELEACEACGRKAGLVDVLSGMLLASTQMERVMDSVLTFEKMEAGKFTLELAPMSMTQLAKVGAMQIQRRAEEEGVILSFEVDPRLPDVVLGDFHRLLQVLLNFLSNGAKFAQRNGAGRVHMRFVVTSTRVQMGAQAPPVPRKPVRRGISDEPPSHGTSLPAPEAHQRPAGGVIDRSTSGSALSHDSGRHPTSHAPSTQRPAGSWLRRLLSLPSGAGAPARGTSGSEADHSRHGQHPGARGAFDSHHTADAGGTADASTHGLGSRGGLEPLSEEAGDAFSVHAMGGAAAMAAASAGAATAGSSSAASHASGTGVAGGSASDAPGMQLRLDAGCTRKGNTLTWAFAGPAPPASGKALHRSATGGLGSPLVPKTGTAQGMTRADSAPPGAAVDPPASGPPGAAPEFLPFVPAPNTTYSVTLDASQYAVTDKVCTVRMEISDNGAGIPAEEQGALFKPWAQLRAGELQKGKGSGLGLCIAKEISTRHGGDVYMRSSPGHGATFGITVPLRVLKPMIALQPERWHGPAAATAAAAARLPTLNAALGGAGGLGGSVLMEQEGASAEGVYRQESLSPTDLDVSVGTPLADGGVATGAVTDAAPAVLHTHARLAMSRGTDDEGLQLEFARGTAAPGFGGLDLLPAAAPAAAVAPIQHGAPTPPSGLTLGPALDPKAASSLHPLPVSPTVAFAAGSAVPAPVLTNLSGAPLSAPVSNEPLGPAPQSQVLGGPTAADGTGTVEPARPAAISQQAMPLAAADLDGAPGRPPAVASTLPPRPLQAPDKVFGASNLATSFSAYTARSYPGDAHAAPAPTTRPVAAQPTHAALGLPNPSASQNGSGAWASVAAALMARPESSASSSTCFTTELPTTGGVGGVAIAGHAGASGSSSEQRPLTFAHSAAGLGAAASRSSSRGSGLHFLSQSNPASGRESPYTPVIVSRMGGRGYVGDMGVLVPAHGGKAVLEASTAVRSASSRVAGLAAMHHIPRIDSDDGSYASRGTSDPGGSALQGPQAGVFEAVSDLSADVSLDGGHRVALRLRPGDPSVASTLRATANQPGQLAHHAVAVAPQSGAGAMPGPAHSGIFAVTGVGTSKQGSPLPSPVGPALGAAGFFAGDIGGSVAAPAPARAGVTSVLSSMPPDTAAVAGARGSSGGGATAGSAGNSPSLVDATARGTAGAAAPSSPAPLRVALVTPTGTDLSRSHSRATLTTGGSPHTPAAVASASLAASATTQAIGPVSPLAVGSGSPAASYTGMTCLVVDDTSTNRLFLARALRRALPGSDVLVAENGQIAVDKVSARMREGGGVPFFITMDREMPCLSGTEAVARLRGMGYNGLVVGVTGSALLEEKQEFTEAGADIVLGKPVNVDTLVELVQARLAADAAP